MLFPIPVGPAMAQRLPPGKVPGEGAGKIPDDIFRGARITVAQMTDFHIGGAVKADGLRGRLFFQFQKIHEPFDRCERGDEGRNLPAELGDGPLYLGDQLQESRHGTVGDGAVQDTEDAPDEGGCVSCLKAEEHETTGYSVVIESFAGVFFHIGL